MTLIYFILILGVTIFIHELGHFIFAKKAGIHCYEFSLGMGPRLFKFTRKNDETEYSIRLFPIGGYVSMAGEQIETDDDVPKDRQLVNKTWTQRFLTIVAGVMFNFLLALVLLFIIALVVGAPNSKPIVGEVVSDSPAEIAGLQEGALIKEINGKKVSSIDVFLLEMQVNSGKKVTLVTDEGTVTIKPTKEDEQYSYGFAMDGSKDTGILASIKYAFTKFFSLIHQMALVIWYLITGTLSLNNLSGPVGIYSLVGQSAQAGFINLVYLTAILCINVGFLNFLPIPAFDGGRLLFLVIEKIKGSPVNPKFENTVHTVGLVLLMILMVAVTYNDIIRLIK